MKRDQTGYNGWASYQTWLMGLWLSNDVGTYEYIQELVKTAKNSYSAAEAIKAYIEELNPVGDEASVFADLMSGALREVDWVEVAEYFLQD